jgi:hypothetical protein
MKTIYLIVDAKDRIPILTATTLEKVKELLDEWMGFPQEGIEYLGFNAYDDRGYHGSYEGEYSYKNGDDMQTFLRYWLSVDENIY